MTQTKTAGRLTSRFDAALVYASQLHRSQIRKGTNIPYISHLLAVTALVLEHGGDEDEAIAALLHDAVEDQGGIETRQEILQRFGERVGAIVDGCTDTDQTPKPPWLERKKAYIEHLREAPPSVRLVSAADKLHNARSILRDYGDLGDALWSRFNSTKEQNRWYYREVVKALRNGEHSKLVAELDAVVSELDRALRD